MGFLCSGMGWACAQTPTKPPLYDEIMNIMQPLEYSGVQSMISPKVNLKVTFNRWAWTLENIHSYDEQGRIVLEEGKYGLCAELATYLFEQLRPLLTPRYIVKFAMVTQADFFSSGQSNHIVLVLLDKADGQLYLIDPSFHKYGLAKNLKEYTILNVQDTLFFVKDRSSDYSFNVDQAVPLYIKGDYLLSFSVTAVDGRFDKDNFIFAITASQRYKFAGVDIVLIGKRKGVFEDYEDINFLQTLLTQQEIRILFTKIKIWIQQMQQS